MTEIRKISLGEYVDNLEIGNKIRKWIGLEERSEDDGVVEKTGISRLGSADMLENFGPSFLLMLAIFIGLVVIVYLLYLVSRVKCCSRKIKNLLTKIKIYTFWNPFIRYSLFSSTKILMVAVISLAGVNSDRLSTILSICIIIFFFAISIFYAILILRKNEDLYQTKNQKKYGTLYIGLRIPTKSEDDNIIRKTLAIIFPMIFILRRLVFAINSVVMFDYPHV